MRNELPLHDATFDGIVNSGTNSTLYFTTSNGAGWTVTLVDVRQLRLDHFRDGNIVILFETTSGEMPSWDGDIRRLFDAPHPSAPPKSHSDYEETLQSTRQAIATGSLTLVEMQPAYGADLLAICRSVELVQH